MAKETTLNELGEMLTHVVKHMATKDHLDDLRTELKDDIADIRAAMVTKVDYHDLRQELQNIRADLKELRANVENMSGFRKEIDHALERIAAIERHLGLNKKIAA